MFLSNEATCTIVPTIFTVIEGLVFKKLALVRLRLAPWAGDWLGLLIGLDKTIL